MHPICRRTANTAVHMTTEWPGLISRVSTYAGLYDIVNGRKLSFVRPGSVVKQFAQDLVTIPANVPAISGGYNWLEGAAQNVNTWSNEFTAARGHTLTDCTSVPSTTEYCLTDINGAPRYATVLTATANNGRVGKYSISVTSGTPMAVSILAKKGRGRGRFTGYDGSNAVIGFFNFDTGAFENITDPGRLLGYFNAKPLTNGWFRLSCIWTPKITGTSGASSIGCELANDWCYISGSQFEVNARVATSYIYTEASPVTRASAGSDTSGNGLSIPLSPAMIASLSAGGEGTIIQWVNLPWDSAIVPSNTTIGILTSRDGVGGLLYVLKTTAGDIGVVSFDGVTAASKYEPTPVGNIRRAVVTQWSSILGRMRVGIYNPTTGALTWSSPTLAGATVYRGFFPIHSSNRLRLFYGGGNYPIGIGAMSWFNRILSSSQILQVCKETQI